MYSDESILLDLLHSLPRRINLLLLLLEFVWYLVSTFLLLNAIICHLLKFSLTVPIKLRSDFKNSLFVCLFVCLFVSFSLVVHPKKELLRDVYRPHQYLIPFPKRRYLVNIDIIFLFFYFFNESIESKERPIFSLL